MTNLSSWRAGALAFLVALISGCVIDSQPLPEGRDAANQPTDDDFDVPPGFGGLIDPSLIFHSAANDEASVRLVVGLPGTLGQTVAQYRLENLTRMGVDPVVGTPATDGGFVATANAFVGERLQVGLFSPGAGSEALPLAQTTFFLFAASGSANLQTDSLLAFAPDAGETFLSAPVNGRTVLSVPGGNLSPETSFILANVSASESIFGQSGPDGALTLELAASRGDQLELFAFDPNESNGGSPSVSLLVP